MLIAYIHRGIAMRSREPGSVLALLYDDGVLALCPAVSADRWHVPLAHALDAYVGISYIGTSQAAELLKLTPVRVWQFINGGRLSAIKVGGALFIPVDDFIKFARKPRRRGRPRIG